MSEAIPMLLFVSLTVVMVLALYYVYRAKSYISKIVTSMIVMWMSFLLANMIVSGTVVLNYAEISAGDVFVYGSHPIQIASLSHFFMFVGVVATLLMLTYAIELIVDTYAGIQEKNKAENEWDGVEQ